MSAPNVICAQFKQTVRKLDAMLRTVAQRANFHDFFRSARPQAPKLELRLTRRGVFARSVRNPLARIRVENRRLLRERGRRAGGAQEGPELGWRRHQRPQRRLAPLGPNVDIHDPVDHEKGSLDAADLAQSEGECQTRQTP